MSWKHRDAKQEARDFRRDAEGVPYDQMELLPPKGPNGWGVVAGYPANPERGHAGGWVVWPIESWTAGYLKAKGATVKERS